MRIRLRRPRAIARDLLALARRRPDDAEDYLEDHVEEWSALAEVLPEDAADILEAIDEDLAGDLIAELDAEEAADVLEEMRDELAGEILIDLPPTVAAIVLQEMLPEEAVDILAVLEDHEREPLLALVDDAFEAEVRKLLTYAPDSAGGLMTTDIAALPIGLTAGEAIERLRNLHQQIEDLSYVYIVDDESRLRGVLSFRELVFNRPGAGLDEVMVPEPLNVNVAADREDVADLIERYHLFGLPVVDDAGVLVGMVSTEAVIETVREEASEDFAASVGAGVAETVYTDMSASVRMRLPWLALNMILALGVALVVETQTGIISREPVLAALMPVVAQLGGNGGSQSLAVVIRSLATDDLPLGRSLEVLTRQTGIGAVNGVILALFAAGTTYGLVASGLLSTSAATAGQVAVVMAIGSLVNLTIATGAGTLIPLGLERLGLDPALASSIFLTVLADVVGFSGFLAVAALLL